LKLCKNGFKTLGNTLDLRKLDKTNKDKKSNTQNSRVKNEPEKNADIINEK